MAGRLPLVLDGTGQTQQLQVQDDLNIPLNERVEMLENQIRALSEFLVEQGFELPDELTENL
jgi:hypothetical protein